MASALNVLSGAAQGIPEPSLVIYGTVRNAADVNTRLLGGTLTWLFQPSAGGQPVTITASLTNINDQFSYVLFVPCETEIFGLSISSNVLRFLPTVLSYDRSLALLGTNLLSFVQPSQSTLNATSRDRGRIERIDLVVSIQPTDNDHNGLPDYWEDMFFGRLGIDPNGDADGDGVKNIDEYRAGTDPTDPNSRFAFIAVEPYPSGGVRVQWRSADGRSYTLQRSSQLLSGFTNLATGITATAPANTFLDTTATTGEPFFYRLKLQP